MHTKDALSVPMASSQELKNVVGMSVPSRMARQLTGGNVQEGLFKVETIGLNTSMGDEDDLEEKPVSVCMIGTGEYTTGYVYGKASDSDKGAGGDD